MDIENDIKLNTIPINIETVTLDMYNIPPIDDYRLSKLAKVCEKRIVMYKNMERFLDEYRDDSSEKKDFYNKIANKLQSSSEFKCLADDIYSHWICHLVFHDSDIGYFAMLYSFTKKMALDKLQNVNQNSEKKEPYIKRYQRQFLFDYLVKFLGKDPYHESMFSGDIKKTFVEGECLDEEFGDHNDELLKLDSRIVEIPFKFCSKLIREHQVELRKGKALIHPNSCLMVISELFQQIIFLNEQRLKPIYNQIKDEDERISGLVDCLKEYNKNYTEHYFDQNQDLTQISIKPENINSASKQHFPLCMKEILGGLRKKHMLKHWGRLQLGMFLKGIGMKMTDNIQLFESELRKTPQGEKKINEYKYYIEHMYGKRGKKTEYTPWSCSKIANKAIPGQGEYFGCPYKYYSDDKLQYALEKFSLTKDQIKEVLTLPKDNYSVRCRKVYELTHLGGRVSKGIGRHPNSYYLSSYFYNKRNQQPQFISNLTEQGPGEQTLVKNMQINQQKLINFLIVNYYLIREIYYSVFIDFLNVQFYL